MKRDKVIIALHDEFTATSLREFILKHDWAETSEFIIAHVVDPPMAGRTTEPRFEKARLRIEQAATLMVNEFAESLRKLSPQHSFMERVLTGNPADELIRLARAEAASLIVMGCRGRKGLTRLLLGSVSGTVASHAPCSVVILKRNHSTRTKPVYSEMKGSASAAL